METNQAGAGAREKIAALRGFLRDFSLDRPWEICHSHSSPRTNRRGWRKGSQACPVQPHGCASVFLQTVRPNPHIKATGGGLARKMSEYQTALARNVFGYFIPQRLMWVVGPVRKQASREIQTKRGVSFQPLPNASPW